MESLRPVSSLRLTLEMGAVFVAAPVLMAFIATPGQLYPSILPLLGLGLVLLHSAPGFRWSSVLHGWRGTRIPLTAAAGLATFVAGWIAIQWLQPWTMFWLWREERTFSGGCWWPVPCGLSCLRSSSTGRYSSGATQRSCRRATVPPF